MAEQKYPRIEELNEEIELRGAWRVFHARHLETPLGTGFGISRFGAPAREFKVIYAAHTFETALREGLIRDRYDEKGVRRIAEHTLRQYASAQIITREPLRVVNLSDGRASNYGIPSDVRHSKDYARSRSFSLEVWKHTNADGLLFRSRVSTMACALRSMTGRSKRNSARLG